MAKVSFSAVPFHRGALILSGIVPMAFASLVKELDAASGLSCSRLLAELHLIVRKRDSVALHEALRIATDVHGLSAAGRLFASRVGAVLTSHALPWHAWEALEQTAFLPFPIDWIATISTSFNLDKMHGFVMLGDGTRAWAYSSAFVDVQMPLSVGDRVVGELVWGRNSLLLRNIRKA